MKNNLTQLTSVIGQIYRTLKSHVGGGQNAHMTATRVTNRFMSATDKVKIDAYNISEFIAADVPGTTYREGITIFEITEADDWVGYPMTGTVLTIKRNNFRVAQTFYERAPGSRVAHRAYHSASGWTDFESVAWRSNTLSKSGDTMDGNFVVNGSSAINLTAQRLSAKFFRKDGVSDWVIQHNNNGNLDIFPSTTSAGNVWNTNKQFTFNQSSTTGFFDAPILAESGVALSSKYAQRTTLVRSEVVSASRC